MKHLKRVFCLVLALACLLGLYMPVLGSETNTVMISYDNEGEALADAPFSLYLVAWKDEDGRLVLAEGFRRYNVDLSEDETTWPALASTLSIYAIMGKIQPTEQGFTDEAGILQFSGLADGIYLVEGSLHKQSDRYYTAEPALVRLPGQDPTTGEVQRTVTLAPKAEWVPDGGGNEWDEETIKALKVWQDDHDPNRPETVTVHLLADGEILDTVELNGDNRWQYTWAGLETGHEYAVAEAPVEGYTVTIQRHGITFVVTNTKERETPPDDPNPPHKPEKPDKPHLPSTPPDPETPEMIPETGQPWAYVLMLAAAGLLFLVIGLAIRRGMRHET